MSFEPLNYESLAASMAQHQLGVVPAEVHGMLCAWVSGRGRDDNAWQTVCFENQINEAIVSIFESIKRDINDDEFGFDLLLPDDEESLEDRGEAVVSWCQGFIVGLGLTGLDLSVYPQIKEALEDLEEISKLDFEALDQSEDEEAAFLELTEYVRGIAMFVYMEMQHVSQSGSMNIDAGAKLH